MKNLWTKAWSVLFVLLLILPKVSFSQEKEENELGYGYALGLYTGPMLPSNIKNVTEIQPSTGLRLVIPGKGMNSSEFWVTSSNAKSVNFYTASYSSKTEVLVEDLIGLIYMGLDVHSYRVNQSNYSTFGGVHVGIGLATPIAGNTYFRTDMKFNLNPGTALFLGFGLEVRYPPSDKKEEGAQ